MAARSGTALAELIAQLVSIDSVNPDLVPGGAGEAEIARFVASWLDRAGLEVQILEPVRGRPSVVGVARGRGSGRTLMLNAHMDTVGHAGMDSPLEPRIDGGRLYGRGAYDMKAGLAAIMLAGATAAEASLEGSVVVTAVADEEVASLGSEEVARRFRADGAIVTEPTGLEVCVAHKGFVQLEIESVGRAAHGSRPDLGIDAIAKMGRVLVELDALDRELRASPSHPLLGSGSLHASLIEGGQEYSSYPERCVLQAERRTVPGESAEQVADEIQAILNGIAGEDAQFLGAARTTFSREPFEVDPVEDVVRSVVRHARDVLAAEPVVAGASYWADTAVFAAAGIPSVLFGPGGEGAHAMVEWVDLEQAERCVETLVAVAADFCGA
jgi:acetylornithine deacetylase